MASLPPEQSLGLSVQFIPTTVRFRRMTFTDLFSEMYPWIFAPHRPMSVLFEPMVTLPSMVPLIRVIFASVPLSAVFRSLSDETVVVEPPSPPVVFDTPLPDTLAQPTSGLGSGGVLQLPELLPPVPEPPP